MSIAGVASQGQAHEPEVGRGQSAAGSSKVRRAVDIRLTLQQEIESGLLFPGTQLDEKLLCERFGVSRTPVREALQQLAARELVTIEPHVGAHVARMSIAEVRAMLEYLSEMEALCAKLAARRVDPALRSALQQSLAICQQSDIFTPDHYLKANAAFHEAIYSGSHSIYLAGQIRKTRRLLQRYRAHEYRSPERIRQSMREHEKIAKAIMAGDEAGASEAMLSHLPSGNYGFSEFLAKVPPHFFELGHASPVSN
jgi:DNA-binding GntR family transcriptional regulator